jgi:hypothetical protein
VADRQVAEALVRCRSHLRYVLLKEQLMKSITHPIYAMLATIVVMTACTGAPTKPAASSIVGTWKLRGPQPKAQTIPQTLSYDFKDNGEVDFTSLGTKYVHVTNGHWEYMKEVPNITRGQMQYRILSAKRLRMISGGSAGEFSYEIDGNELTLGQSAYGYTLQHVYVRQR